jgi:hypothetical protein
MFKEQIARGIALINEKMPDWRENISIESLEMSMGDSCILGQLYSGGYSEGIDHLLGCHVGPDERLAFAVAHGFNIAEADEDGHAWEELQQAWITALQGGKP